MPNILDHVSSAPLLEIDDLPRLATCKEWFAITRRLVQDTIADINLDRAAEAEVIEALTGAGLLDGNATMTGQGRSIALQLISAKSALQPVTKPAGSDPLRGWDGDGMRGVG